MFQYQNYRQHLRSKDLIFNGFQAIKNISDGASVMFGGFGLCGTPLNLIEAVKEKRIKDLTAISNNCGENDEGLIKLVEN